MIEIDEREFKVGDLVCGDCINEKICTTAAALNAFLMTAKDVLDLNDRFKLRKYVTKHCLHFMSGDVTSTCICCKKQKQEGKFVCNSCINGVITDDSLNFIDSGNE